MASKMAAPRKRVGASMPPLNLADGLTSYLQEADAELLDRDVHHGGERHKTKTFSLHSKDIRDKLVSDRPIFVLNLDQENRDLEELLRHSLMVSYVVYMKGYQTEESFQSFVEANVSDLPKDVWIVTREGWLEGEHKFKTLIDDWIRCRQKAMDDAEITSGAFPVQVIVRNGKLAINKVKNWPWTGNKAASQRVLKFDSMKQLAVVLEKHYKNRLNKIANVLHATDPGIYFHLKIQLMTTFAEPPNELEKPRFQRLYISLRELIEDPHTNFRQQLQQLYKTPNVRVILDLENMHMLLELRPLEYDGAAHLVREVERGSIGLTLENNYENLRRTTIDGQIKVTVHSSLEPVRSPLELVKEFCSRNPNQDGPTVTKLKEIIVTNRYREMLKNEKCTPYHFLMWLNNQGCMGLLTEIKESTGRNALHMAVAEKRIDFLRMIFFTNNWGILRHKTTNVSNTVSYSGFTPRRLAEAFAFKSKGQLVLEEYDYLEDLFLNMSVLGKACIEGKLDLVKMIAAADKSLMKPICLFYACGGGHAEVVDFLMKNNIDHQKRNSRNENCLQMAAMFGHVKVLETLCKHTFDIMGKRNVDRLNALDYCVMNGDMKSLRLFKEHNFPMEASALRLAVQYGRSEVFQFLTEECNISADTGKDRDDRLAMHHAVVQGDINSLRTLLDLDDADVHSVDMFNKNVFHLVAENNRFDILPILLERVDDDRLKEMINSRDYFTGKDLYFLVRGKDRGRRAWHWIELRRLYIKLFKDTLAQGQIDVAQHGQIMFSGFGANPDEETNKKLEEMEKEALTPENRKADMTPLHYAVNKEYTEVVHWLLAHGADPNIRDNFGATPVHHAAMRGNLEIVRALVDAGGVLQMKTKDGKSVDDIALENGHHHILNYMEGRPVLRRAEEFLSGALQQAKQELGPAVLMRKRASGEDIKRHIIDTLRGLTIDVNLMLMEMGSGPILEASSED